jgi:sigma-E factor negative regulatory protein RseA
MSDEFLERLSALMDGETGDLRGNFSLSEILADINARRRWERYHLIKQSMKGELPPRVEKDFAGAVMARVESEGLEVETPRRPVLDWSRLVRPVAGFAIAASVAVVAVVAWRDLNEGDEAPQIIAQTPIAPADPAQAVPASTSQGTYWEHQQPAVESRLNTYLVNHAEYGSGRIQGMLPHVRVVGYDQSH